MFFIRIFILLNTIAVCILMEMFYFKFYELGAFVSTVIFILVCCLSFIFNSTFLLISFVLGFEEENGEKSSHVTGTQLRV